MSRFSLVVLLLFFSLSPRVHAGYAQSADPDMETFDSPSAKRTAALSRASQNDESFKKIVKAPTPQDNRVANEEVPADDALVPSTSAQDEIKIIKKSSVETSPAPGTKSSDDEKEPAAKTDSGEENSSDTQISISTHAATKKSGKTKAVEPTSENPPDKIDDKSAEKRAKSVEKLAHLKAPAPLAESVASSVSSEQSLKWLTNGNNRYVKKQFRADGRSQVDRTKALSNPHPHAIVLSCSDSRVPPELVFDQGLGEIVTVRAAGEALDDSVIASIEHAILKYSPHLLVVMGHTKCDAVEAALNTREGQSAGSEHLDHLLAEIRPHLKSRASEKQSTNLEVEGALNADGVARDLMARSEIIRKKVDDGELLIKPALYWLDSGKVKFY